MFLKEITMQRDRTQMQTGWQVPVKLFNTTTQGFLRVHVNSRVHMEVNNGQNSPKTKLTVKQSKRESSKSKLNPKSRRVIQKV